MLMAVAACLTYTVNASAQSLDFSGSALEAAFAGAAKSTGVPEDLLKAISWVETRWRHHLPQGDDDATHQRSYGLMGLRDDDWFGHSLPQAARLVGRTPEELLKNPALNILGAAKFLAHLRATSVVTSNSLESWFNVVATYSGIPAADDAHLYAEDVYQALRDGQSARGIVLQSHTLNEAVGSKHNARSASGADQAGVDWDPSPNQNPGALRPRFIVIHTTEGSFAGSVSWLKNPKSQSSSHYILRARDGYTKQLVRETDKAWHVKCWNPYSFGLEHEGFADSPDGLTPELYKSSVTLVKAIAARHNIPLDGDHVFGHDFWSKPEFQGSPVQAIGNCNTHHDPGQYWNWKGYFDLIKGL